MSNIISVKSKGKWMKTRKHLLKIKTLDYRRLVESCAIKGVVALSEATPKDSGSTADSWGYDITIDDKITRIAWTNDNVTSSGMPVVVLLQYGHGTRNGKFVKGFDFVSPAIYPVFDEIADTIWKEVTR